MKTIIVHYNTSTIEITPPPSSAPSTWGQLAQHFCEHSLLHPPKLLQLLISLSSQERMSCYQLRFGDGYATIVKPTWNNNTSTSDDDDMIEANVTLKPRGKGPLSKVQNLSQSIIPDKLKDDIAVDLYIELVGRASLDVEDDDNDFFPMTQTPFPVDETKTNVLFVKEHSQFEGVVDTFSIEKKTEWAAKATASAVVAAASPGAGASASGSTAAKAISGKKRKQSQSPTATKDIDTTTPTTKEGGDKTKKKKKAKTDKTNEGKKPASSTKSKKAAKMDDKKPASNIKSKKAPNNNNKPAAAVTSSPLSNSASPAPSATKKSPQKKAAATAAATSATKKSPTKKKAAVTPSKKTVDQIELSAEALSSAKKVKSSTTVGAKADDNGSKNLKEDKNGKGDKNGKEDTAQIPKRPPNGYVMFSSHVRSDIMKENPELKFAEVAKKIGQAYQNLDEDERKKYHELARIAFVKFKAEHPNLPKSTKKKKKKKNKKNGEEEEDNEVIAEVVVAAVEEEGTEDHGEESTRKKKKKKKNKKNGEEEEANEVIAEVVVAAVEEEEGTEDHGEKEKKDRPKRPLNAYMLFSNEVRSKVKEDNPDASPKEVMSLVGKEYRTLDKSEKDKYRIVADAAMKKFKEEHGENAMRNKPRKNKKMKKQSGNNGVVSDPTGDNLAHIPSEPAEGLPDGWVTRNVPRKTGDRADMYWFSPKKSFKFRSKAQVTRFQSSFEKSGGDEGAAMELYTKGEKKEKSDVAVAAAGSAKKRKRNSGKKNDAAVAAATSAFI